MKVVTLSQVIG